LPYIKKFDMFLTIQYIAIESNISIFSIYQVITYLCCC